ncbi:Nucleoside-diphosphate-sugar epimerases [Klebsiella aerogenes]|nr:Nucleoside-diphosphate-sugar epimerases [Klebsiella aerogenes]
MGNPPFCPVAADTRLWLLSPRNAIKALIHGHELAEAQLTDGRVINLCGLSVSVEQMIAALRQVAGSEVAQRITSPPMPPLNALSIRGPAISTRAMLSVLGLAPTTASAK